MNIWDGAVIDIEPSWLDKLSSNGFMMCLTIDAMRNGYQYSQVDGTRPYFEANFTTGTDVNSALSHHDILGSSVKASMRDRASSVWFLSPGCLNTAWVIISARRTPWADQRQVIPKIPDTIVDYPYLHELVRLLQLLTVSEQLFYRVPTTSLAVRRFDSRCENEPFTWWIFITSSISERDINVNIFKYFATSASSTFRKY